MVNSPIGISLWSWEYLLIILTAIFAVSVMFTMGSGMTLLVNQNGGGTSVKGFMVFGSSVGSIWGVFWADAFAIPWGTRKVLMTSASDAPSSLFYRRFFPPSPWHCGPALSAGLLYPSIFVAIPAAVDRYSTRETAGRGHGLLRIRDGFERNHRPDGCHPGVCRR